MTGGLVAVRLAWQQARWAPGHLTLATLAVAVAQIFLLLTLALGLAVDQAATAWLGANLPVDVLEVVPARLAVGGFGFAGQGALGAASLDAAAVADLAALPGVRAASSTLQLDLPLVAEGGEALFGEALRADVVLVGDDDPRLAALLAGPDAPLGATPNADAAAPVPVVVHPRLLALYNAALAPSLHTPQLRAETLVGLQVRVQVGRSHLPGRAAVRRSGSFVAQLVGLHEAAAPLALTVSRAQAERLWRTYAAAAGAPPVARVRLHLADAAAAPALSQRIARMGFAVDDQAAQVRAATRLGRRVAVGFGLALAALAAGYALMALSAHVAHTAGDRAVLVGLGLGGRQLAAAAAWQGAAVALLGSGAAQLAAPAAAAGLQAALARLAEPLGLQLPPAFVFAAPLAAACALGATALAALGTAVAVRRALGAPRLDNGAAGR